MSDIRRKMVAGCTVPCKHNQNGQCAKPMVSKGLLMADEKCADYEEA